MKNSELIAKLAKLGADAEIKVAEIFDEENKIRYLDLDVAELHDGTFAIMSPKLKHFGKISGFYKATDF